MTDAQWDDLLELLAGKAFDPPLVSLLVDCPWLPGWYGVTVFDYLADDRVWLEANLKAAGQFPNVMFVPGFWSEYGMCTEPSAFGCRCIWPSNDFPFAGRLLYDYSEIKRLKKPNCRTDGMGPFVIKRLERCRKQIEAAGHQIRFAVSRGPLNIATYLLGHSETLIGVKTDPEDIHRLLTIISDYITDWLRYQAQCFPSIDGMLVLDDLIGFIGPADFDTFVVPYFEQIAAALDVNVKILHNDCHGLVTAQRMPRMGFNVFHFGFQHTFGEVRQAAGDEVVLMGNIPPRDVLGAGTPHDVRHSVTQTLGSMPDTRRIWLSCGGGTPPDTPTANIEALCEAAGYK